jgi:hypothetical protein
MTCGAGRSVNGGEPDRRARHVSEVEALARNGSGFGELTGWAKMRSGPELSPAASFLFSLFLFIFFFCFLFSFLHNF